MERQAWAASSITSPPKLVEGQQPGSPWPISGCDVLPLYHTTALGLLHAVERTSRHVDAARTVARMHDIRSSSNSSIPCSSPHLLIEVGRLVGVIRCASETRRSRSCGLRISVSQRYILAPSLAFVDIHCVRSVKCHARHESVVICEWHAMHISSYALEDAV